MKRAARRWWLAVGLAAVCVAGVCAQNPRGTQQKVGNPLNDLLNQAREAIARKDFEAALAPLQRVIAEQPDFAYAHFQLGYAFTGLKRWDDAKREYSRAAELDPRMAEAYLNLGMLLLGRERGAAVAPLRKAVELLPSQSRPRLLLGVALEETDDLAGAIDALKGAATLDPQDFDIRAELGAVFLRAQRCPEAEVEFRAALSLQPDSPAARLGLANALNARHKPEAAAAYRSYLERKPADKEARARLARLLSEA
ncbi:MAG TPA: tetratricopeptide repeat protein, partial [Methylomirabilota bacterium]|nr:tetratricopeptide repeat protein [Methylomirabilota bacterium]